MRTERVEARPSICTPGTGRTNRCGPCCPTTTTTSAASTGPRCRRGGARRVGRHRLADVAVELSLKLASALERVAGDQGVAAVDLADVWFVD